MTDRIDHAVKAREALEMLAGIWGEDLTAASSLAPNATTRNPATAPANAAPPGRPAGRPSWASRRSRSGAPATDTSRLRRSHE